MGLVSNSGVTASASSVGVLGGTFDPVHSGHLAIAEAVRNELGLDVVLFVRPRGRDLYRRSRRPVAAARSPGRKRGHTARNGRAGCGGFSRS